jgi:hypothetical protein
MMEWKDRIEKASREEVLEEVGFIVKCTPNRKRIIKKINSLRNQEPEL